MIEIHPGDVVTSTPCRVLVINVGGHLADGWCERCETLHIINIGGIREGRPPWRKETNTYRIYQVRQSRKETAAFVAAVEKDLDDHGTAWTIQRGDDVELVNPQTIMGWNTEMWRARGPLESAPS